jgi:ribosomal protein S18 acetylase RimI-like enzyme
VTEAAWTLRPAAAGDCRRIAELYRISSDGVADYIWSRLAAPGEDILDVGARRYGREDSPFSYRNCKLVVLADAVIGMLVAFPMPAGDGEAETDPVLVPYSRLEEPGSYYVCGMAVEAHHRGQGIGSALLDEAERAARVQRLDVLSLIVFEQNAGARRLYEGRGYVAKLRHPVVPHPLIRYTGDALLMVKRLAGAA